MWPFGVIFYLALFVVFLFIMIKTAPLGYEDKNGFHFLNKKQG